MACPSNDEKFKNQIQNSGGPGTLTKYRKREKTNLIDLTS